VPRINLRLINKKIKINLNSALLTNIIQYLHLSILLFTYLSFFFKWHSIYLSPPSVFILSPSPPFVFILSPSPPSLCYLSSLPLSSLLLLPLFLSFLYPLLSSSSPFLYHLSHYSTSLSFFFFTLFPLCLYPLSLSLSLSGAIKLVRFILFCPYQRGRGIGESEVHSTCSTILATLRFNIRLGKTYFQGQTR
jgi:hypothetical protein